MKRILSILSILTLFACFATAQVQEDLQKLDRTQARNHGAMSPATSYKLQSMLRQDQIAEYMQNLREGVVSDYYLGHNEMLKEVAAFNQIGEGFPVNFVADADLNVAPTKARNAFSWATSVTSRDAEGMRLHLDLTDLDDNDKIYLVDADTLHNFGPYTAADGDFWGPRIDGETTMVVLVSEDNERGNFEIKEGSHIFMPKRAAKACEDDLNCEDSTTRQVATAVGHYSFVKNGGTYVCTGTLLNPQDGSFTPYFLTANHCVSSQSVASSMHVYWDYRSTACNSGQGVSKGSVPQTVGGTLLATSSSLDGTLVRLPDSGGSRHFAAWNATAIPSNNSSVVGIHHPAGDYMRVSKGTVTGTGETSCGGSFVNEIRIDWIDSLTEGGSSGSAIFNSNWEVIGDESGCGPENCSGSSAPGNYDWFGSFYHFYPQVSQWLGGSTPPPPPPGGSELENGVSQNFNLADEETVAFTIDVPANATDLTVTITGSGDADLYVKRAAINWPSDKGSHNDAEFKAPYKAGSSESVTFANPAEDTWNVLVHGYDPSSGTITATWTTGGTPGGSTWTYVNWARETPHNYSNNRTYEYTYESAGASQVGIHFVRLDTESNYDFVSILDENGTEVYKVSGNLISNGSGSAFGRTDGWAIVNGSKITVRLVTDYSVRDWGYQTDQAANYK